MTKYKSQIVPVARNNTPDIVDVSGGTLLIVLAQNLPGDYHYKSWLVAAAPAVTTSVAFLWKLITKEYTLFKDKRDIRRKEMTLRKERGLLLRDPDISDQTKKFLREQREREELASIKQLSRELNVLRGSK